MVTTEEVREAFVYHPQSGKWLWAKPKSTKMKPGYAAGRWHKDSRGYYSHRTKIGGRTYSTLNLIHLYMTGEWPPQKLCLRDRGTSLKWKNICPLGERMKLETKQKPNENTTTSSRP